MSNDDTQQKVASAIREALEEIDMGDAYKGLTYDMAALKITDELLALIAPGEPVHCLGRYMISREEVARWLRRFDVEPDPDDWDVIEEGNRNGYRIKADELLALIAPQPSRDGCPRCIMHWLSDVYDLGHGEIGAIIHMGGQRYRVQGRAETILASKEVGDE